MAMLDRISIRGFKSIEKLENFELKSLNVLIGANGAGKSNFVDFFRLLKAMGKNQLQAHIEKYGPADGYFYNGVSYTKLISAHIEFEDVEYTFHLEPTAEGKLFLARELLAARSGMKRAIVTDGQPGSLFLLANDPANKALMAKASQSVASLQIYHFHDTSWTAGMRRAVGTAQGSILAPDANNLAAYLLNLRNTLQEHYDFLCQTIRRIAPYFDDFDLRIIKENAEDMVRLHWRKVGTDYVFWPGHFSDGTIRFICLAAVLLQPNPPATIVIDEPELGLHPDAISILAGLIRSASSKVQIIVSTQSPLLVNEFEPDQIITVDQVDGASRFSRLNVDQLSQWLEEYTLGELWQKGTIAGGVNHA